MHGQVDITAGHEVFQRLVAEAGYRGSAPATGVPRWAGDSVTVNPTLVRARELDGERDLLRMSFPGLDTPSPTPPPGTWTPPPPDASGDAADPSSATARTASTDAESEGAAGVDNEDLVPGGGLG